MILGISIENVAYWVIAVITVVLAGAYFYFSVIKKIKHRARLFELAFILVAGAVFLLPVVIEFDNLNWEAVSVLGIFIYFIGRLLSLFK